MKYEIEIPFMGYINGIYQWDIMGYYIYIYPFVFMGNVMGYINITR